MGNTLTNVSILIRPEDRMRRSFADAKTIESNGNRAIRWKSRLAGPVRVVSIIASHKLASLRGPLRIPQALRVRAIGYTINGS